MFILTENNPIQTLSPNVRTTFVRAHIGMNRVRTDEANIEVNSTIFPPNLH